MNHRAIIKSINRWTRKTKPFAGGRTFGVDFATWYVCYPQIAQTYLASAEVITGRKGRFMPHF